MIDHVRRGPRSPNRLGRPAPLQRFGVRLAILGGIALAVRLLYILVIAPAPIGLDGDWRFYHSAANLIAHGHFYYRGIFNRAYVTAEHPPLYPLVLSGVSLFGGVDVVSQRVVGCVVGSVSVLLFGVLGRRLGGARAGLVAALIAAIYPPLVVVDGALMSEPLLVLGLLIALLLGYRLLEAPSAGKAAALGAVIGLSTLAHTEALLLLPLLVLPLAWGPRDGRGARSAAALAACALMLAPWVARNLVVFNRLTLATNSNTVIAGANCQRTYYGRDIGWWRLDCDEQGRSFNQLVQGDANIHPALRYAGRHLTRVPLVAAVRILRTFSMYQPLREGNGQLRRRSFDIIGLAIYYPLLVLAGLGLWRMRGRRWPLLALISVSVVVSAIDSGLPRLRVPADVALVLLAALALGSRRRRQAGLDGERSQPEPAYGT